MARGDTIATTVPSVGDAETGGTTDLLTILSALVTIAETKVTPSEIDMDATLDFNSQAGENVKYFEFVTQGSDPSTAETLYTKNDGATDELYFKNGSGSVVQITNGGALNVAATGSVTGAGYGSGGVAVNWNSAGGNYQMKSGSGADDYADVTCDDLQLRDGSSHAVTLTAQSMAADYTVTFPAAVPGSEQFVTMDNSGNLAYADNATPYTNFKHAGVQVSVNMGSCIDGVGHTWSRSVYDAGDIQNGSTAGTPYFIVPLEVKPGDVITNIGLHVVTNSGTDTFTLELRRVQFSTSTDSLIDSDSSFASTGEVSWDVNDTTVAAGYMYYLKVQHAAGSGSDVSIVGINYTYQR